MWQVQLTVRQYGFQLSHEARPAQMHCTHSNSRFLPGHVYLMQAAASFAILHLPVNVAMPCSSAHAPLLIHLMLTSLRGSTSC